MKKKHLLLSMFCYCLIISCNKQQVVDSKNLTSTESESTSNILKEKQLRNDPVFQAILKKQTELNELIVLGQNNSQKQFNKTFELIQKLQNTTNLTDDQLEKRLDALLNLPQNKKVKDYQKYFADNWEILKTKYGASILTDEYINTEVSEAYKTNYSVLGNKKACLDLTNYTVCTAGVTAAAILGHAACVGTLFGAPICFALVATIQVAGINECATTYCGSPIFGND